MPLSIRFVFELLEIILILNLTGVFNFANLKSWNPLNEITVVEIFC